MTTKLPRTNYDREQTRYLQSQNTGITGLVGATNIAPMRELIPQIGVRRTDAIATYQTIGTQIVHAVPFVITADYWDVNGFYWVCDTFGTGNICVGVYSEAGIRLITTGSVATANVMAVAVSPAIRIPRNRYYFAMVMNNNTDTVGAFTGTPYGADAVCLGAGGVKVHNNFAFPLPATVTLATAGYTYIPAVYVGIAAPPTV